MTTMPDQYPSESRVIAPDFRVEAIDYALGLHDLRAVREPVFVQEQQVPLALEWDALDPICVHVIARDDAGNPIGTGRLVPPNAENDHDDHAPNAAATNPASFTARIGRMAVLAQWRGRGVGDALLLALIEQAHLRGWSALALHAQVSAIGFYARQGFVPYGARFMEAGIEHQSMRRSLRGPTAVETREAAVAMVPMIIASSRRALWIYSRVLDPGLLDTSPVLDALRKLATRTHRVEIHLLLQDAGTPQRSHAPLLGLAQRQPSVFVFREVIDPADRNDASAYIVNDNAGYYFRPLGHRFDGEVDLQAAGRARQLANSFQPVWERARLCSDYRALGI